MVIDEHLRRMAEEFPDRTAYTVVDTGALSFSEWDEEANALARGLVGCGLRPGDRVGIHLDPSSALRWLVSYTAVHRAGGVAVPMNPGWLPPRWPTSWPTRVRRPWSLTASASPPTSPPRAAACPG